MIILKNPSKKRAYGFVNKYGRDIKVEPEKEVVVEEDDLINLHSTSRTFTGGYLVVKNVKELPESVRYMFETEEDMFVIEPEEIKLKLSDRIGGFLAYMKEVAQRNNSNEKRELFEIAKSMEDLNLKKARKIEEVTGFDFRREEEIEKEKK